MAGEGITPMGLAVATEWALTVSQHCFRSRARNQLVACEKVATDLVLVDGSQP